MDFTDRLAYCGPQPVFSPDGRLLASADGYRLVVRAADSLAVVALCSCLDRIESIAWSPDSDHLLCGLFLRATVQVFCASGERRGLGPRRCMRPAVAASLQPQLHSCATAWLVSQVCRSVRSAPHMASRNRAQYAADTRTIAARRRVLPRQTPTGPAPLPRGRQASQRRTGRQTASTSCSQPTSTSDCRCGHWWTRAAPTCGAPSTRSQGWPSRPMAACWRSHT